MALLGATTVQPGAIVLTITCALFPNAERHRQAQHLNPTSFGA